VGAAVVVLLGEVQRIRRIVGRPRAAFVGAVFAHEQPALERVILGREADRVTVAVSPREWFDCFAGIGFMELGAQDRAVANTVMSGAGEGLHSASFVSNAERGIAAGKHSPSGVEHVLTEHDVLAGNIGLILPATVIATDDPAVGRRALRPVDKVVLKVQLLGRVVTGWQVGNEGRDLPGSSIYGDDARAVVVLRRAKRLARGGSVQAASF